MKRTIRFARIAAAAAVALFLSAGVPAQENPMASMSAMEATDAPRIPPVTGFLAGETIFFLHTEASDAEVAQLLTDMMGSPVLTVPTLAQAPETMLAPVYVFTNGVRPDGPRGPLGFQPDVFDSPPGTPGYTPLRRIRFVTWGEERTARLLKSANEVRQAVESGAVSVEETGVVVNMPLLTWPGGRR